MLPGFYYLLTAFVLVIFGTKNGRALLTQRGLVAIRDSVLYIPFPIRRWLFRIILGTHLPIAKKLLDFASKPQGIEKAWIQQKDISSLTTAHWIGSPTLDLSANDLDLIVLYMHGGGFTVGNSKMYMGSFIAMLNRMKQQQGLNARIFSVDYPSALTHPYPSAPDACFEAYQYLVHTLSISPSRIVLAGDSAGGNLVATLLLRLCDERIRRQQDSLPPLPQPAGGVMISPWVDLHSDSPTYTSNEKYDVVTRSQLERHVSYYLPQQLQQQDDQLLRQPSLSPVYGSYTSVTCPLMVAYSDSEVFQYDVLRFIDRVRQDKVKVDVLCRPDQPHIWIIEPTFATRMDVWQEDLAKVTDWITGCIVN